MDGTRVNICWLKSRVGVVILTKNKICTVHENLLVKLEEMFILHVFEMDLN